MRSALTSAAINDTQSMLFLEENKRIGEKSIRRVDERHAVS